MIIGPFTIRWTKDIQAEQAKRDSAKRVSVALTEALLHDNHRYKALMAHWGQSEDIIEVQGVRRPKPPKGAVVTV